MTLQGLMGVMGVMGASASGPARTFAAVLQLFCPAALLPGLLRCLCRLLLPFWAFTALSICCLACSAAFVDFYCLSGHGRLCLLRCLCRLSLPFWAFTAFVGLLPGLLPCLCRLLLPFWAWATLSTFTTFINFYCLCRLALPLSDFSAVVRYYCFYQLLLPLSACTACV